MVERLNRRLEGIEGTGRLDESSPWEGPSNNVAPTLTVSRQITGDPDAV
jgi:hypothetical protein